MVAFTDCSKAMKVWEDVSCCLDGRDASILVSSMLLEALAAIASSPPRRRGQVLETLLILVLYYRRLSVALDPIETLRASSLSWRLRGGWDEMRKQSSYLSPILVPIRQNYPLAWRRSMPIPGPQSSPHDQLLSSRYLFLSLSTSKVN